MDKKRIRIITIFITLTLLSILIPTAAGSNKGQAKGQEYPAPFLRGNQINIILVYYHGITEIEIPADEASFVIQGWLGPENFQKTTPEEKREILGKDTYGFKLQVGGEDVQLRKHVHFYKKHIVPHSGELKYNVLIKSYYIQYDANHFSAGDVVEFTGTWIYMDESYSFTLTVTFT